jgi:RNA polymerase sigma-70 factor, ECF subfamily
MDAFRDELQKMIPRLRQYACALTRDPSQADDLVQAALTHAMEKETYWVPGTDLRAWLFTIMHNLFVSQARRRNRSPVCTSTRLEHWAPAAPGRQEDALVLRDLDRGLARLPTDYRLILLLVGVQDMSYQEASSVLQIPMGTLKSRLSRARDILRRYIEHGEAAPARAA